MDDREKVRRLLHDNAGAAWPRAAIVDELKLSPREVSKALQALKRAGDVECVLDEDDGTPVWQWIGCWLDEDD